MPNIDHPLDAYPAFQDKLVKAMGDIFDGYVKESGITPEANRSLYAKYDAQTTVTNAAQKSYRSRKAIRWVVIVLVVACILGLAWSIFQIATIDPAQASNLGYFIAVGILTPALIGLGVLWGFVSKRVKEALKDFSDKEAVSKALRDQLDHQLEPLRAVIAYRFTPDTPMEAIHAALPQLTVYPRIEEVPAALVGATAYDPDFPADETELSGFTGYWGTNPFLWENRQSTWMADKVYVGYLTINWTTTETDSEGNEETEYHTQTLVASKAAPAPNFGTTATLYYRNAALPPVNFSRSPTGIGPNISDKNYERFLKKGERKFTDRMDESIKSGGKFVAMANTEFESVFDCLNRDNEHGFRMLFTAIAQTNIIALARSVPYGDDWTIKKTGQMTMVQTTHDQYAGIEYPSIDLSNLSVEKLKNNFVGIASDFFRRLYFDFAPLISIPFYQENGDYQAETKDLDPTDIPALEWERLVNRIPSKLVDDPKTTVPKDTRKILKTARMQTGFRIQVRTSSYQGIPRTDLVPVWGDDGKLHSVPVPWVEYISLNRETHWIGIDLKRLGLPTALADWADGAPFDFIRRHGGWEQAQLIEGMLLFPEDDKQGESSVDTDVMSLKLALRPPQGKTEKE